MPWHGDFNHRKNCGTRRLSLPQCAHTREGKCHVFNRLWTRIKRVRVLQQLEEGFVNETKLLPVIAYIHGGAFVMGSTRIYGAEYFMDQDVVLVTMNYRLGALGNYSIVNLKYPLSGLVMTVNIIVFRIPEHRRWGSSRQHGPEGSSSGFKMDPEEHCNFWG